MSKYVAIENDGKGGLQSFTATTHLFGVGKPNQFSSATLQGYGNCPFAATKELRDVLEALINQAKLRLKEIDADLKEGVITR